MATKRRVAVLFGGQSAEHEVSLQSAQNIIKALDPEKYDVIPIGIGKDGQWYLEDSAEWLLNSQDPKLIKLNTTAQPVMLGTGSQSTELMIAGGNSSLGPIDVVFPVLHGPMGEDGTIQGLLKLAHLPFVGAGVLGSAVGMDKDVMKRLLKAAGLPVTDFLVFREADRDSIDFETVKNQFGLPVFVKAANLGSSVSVSKVIDKESFDEAIEEAFRYDRKILIEKSAKGREIEISVLGNNNPVASLPGEIIVKADYYSYEAKYIDDDGAEAQIPADLPADQVKQIQDIAIQAFKVLCCEGLARVDFFITDKNEILINEINTMPGFTRISMYPKMWEASGVPVNELVDRLIDLAIERFEKERRLKTDYQL